MAFKIADFFADLKINGDTLTIKTMVNSMADMKLETLGEIAALGSLAVALKNAGQEAMKMASGYTAINKEYGINTEMLQRWQNVAGMSNVPREDVATSFASMAKLLASPFIGDPNSEFMKAAGLLGIQGANTMDVDTLNEALRVAIPNYIKQWTPVRGAEKATTDATLLAQQLGPMASIVQLYRLSSRDFNKREFAAGIMSDSDIKQWTALNNEVVNLKQNMFIFGEKVLKPLLPSATGFVADVSSGLLSASNGKVKDSTKIEMLGAGLLSGAAVGFGITSGFAVIPAALLGAYAGFRAYQREHNVTINNDVDIHAHGSDPLTMAIQHKNELTRLNQSDYNFAQSLGAGMPSY